MRVAAALALLLMLAALPCSAQQFYKWTDANGRVQYTQTPPPQARSGWR